MPPAPRLRFLAEALFRSTAHCSTPRFLGNPKVQRYTSCGGRRLTDDGGRVITPALSPGKEGSWTTRLPLHPSRNVTVRCVSQGRTIARIMRTADRPGSAARARHNHDDGSIYTRSDLLFSQHFRRRARHHTGNVSRETGASQTPRRRRCRSRLVASRKGRFPGRVPSRA